MDKFIHELLNRDRLKITEKELMDIFYEYDYNRYLQLVRNLIDESFILIPKGKKNNGKFPPFFTTFQINKPNYEVKVKSKTIGIYPELNFTYYYKRILEFDEDQPFIQKLSNFLYMHMAELETSMAINERSYQIFKNEKFLKEKGKSFFKKIKYDFSKLNAYITHEPYFEDIHELKKANTILIVENKDTWDTLKRILQENRDCSLFGKYFNILIYGEGKKIIESFAFIEERNYKDTYLDIWYCGDIDNEGFLIYQKLSEKYKEYEIKLFRDIYKKMLILAGDLKDLRDLSEEQEKFNSFAFLDFDDENTEKLKYILYHSKIIPQEILNYKVIQGLLGDDPNV